MKKSARILTILVALMMLSFAFAASASALKIGATYYSLQNEFTMRMDNAGKKYCEENGIEFLSYDGNYDAATQLAQVETMIADGCDAIILNPQDAIACAAAV
ncbi:MAG: substrate-binding domain-containing protein, partial [Eubacteriales bacterium]|nr:substrate-binding domain-containing protein [Eubacteriales bacterium]